MPMTLEEHKAEINQLLALLVAHCKQVHQVQEEIGNMLKAAGDAHGLAAWPLVQDAVKQMKAAAVLALPIDSQFIM
jgi:hypothetical protein